MNKQVASTEAKTPEKVLKVKVTGPALRYKDNEYAQGEVIEMPEKDFQELSKPIVGHHAFNGERHAEDGDLPRHKYQRVALVG